MAEKLEFRQYLRPRIRFHGAVGSLCVFAISLTSFLLDILQETQDISDEFQERFEFGGDCYLRTLPERFDFGKADHRTVYFVSLLVVVCAAGTFFVISVLGSFNKFSKDIWWESTFCITACILLVMMPCATNDDFSTDVAQYISGDDSAVSCLWQDANFRGGTSAKFLSMALLMDVLITAIALCVPLRPIVMFFVLLSCNLSFLSSGFFSTVVEDTQVSDWLTSAVSLIMLSLAAFRGACDQDVLRWKTWKGSQELQETSAMGMAMQCIATSFCDCVIILTPDLRLPDDEDTKLQAFFGTGWRCRPITDFLSVADARRLNKLVAQDQQSNLPGCMSVTILPNGGCLPLEVNLLLVRVVSGSWLLGVSQSSEQAMPLSADALQPAAPSLVVDSDENCESFPDTSTIFAKGSLENIMQVGLYEHWLIQQHLLVPKFEVVLGEGGQSIVYRGTYCGSDVALKQAKQKKKITQPDQVNLNAARELRALRRLRHPNIVLFHGAYLTDDGLAVVVEHVKGQSLSEFASGRQLKLTFQSRLMLDICSALWYLSVQEPYPVLHGDVKPANIMIEVRIPGVGADIEPHAKLIDFGLSKILSPGARPLGGTTKWLAPETLAAQAPSVGAEIFSFGCIMFFIMIGKVPYTMKDKDMLQYIEAHASLPALLWPASSQWEYETGLIPLCSACTSLEVTARPTWPDIDSQLKLPSSAMALHEEKLSI